MKEEYKEVTYQGILVTNYGKTFYLMLNRPIDKEMWMDDSVKMFLGCVDKGELVHLTVQGFTLFPDARGTVKVKQEEVEEPDIDVYKSKTYWLDKELRNEPQSLAE